MDFFNEKIQKTNKGKKTKKSESTLKFDTILKKKKNKKKSKITVTYKDCHIFIAEKIGNVIIPKLVSWLQYFKSNVHTTYSSKYCNICVN